MVGRRPAARPSAAWHFTARRNAASCGNLLPLSPLLLIVLLCTIRATAADKRTLGAKPVELASVRAIVLYKGQRTASRRPHGSAPQLKCVGRCEFEPGVVRCNNVAVDGPDVQWECEADLPAHLKFGRTEVVCEGFDSPKDERVLEGSCGLQYVIKQVPGKRPSFRYALAKPLQTLGSWAMLAFLVYLSYSLYKVYVARGPHARRSFLEALGAHGAGKGVSPPLGSPRSPFAAAHPLGPATRPGRSLA